MEGLRSAFRQLSLSDIARLALVGSTIAIIIVLIITASGVLTPFIVGLVLAYLLTPVVNRLNRWLPRWAAILLVYAVGIGVVKHPPRPHYSAVDQPSHPPGVCHHTTRGVNAAGGRRVALVSGERAG
jgi:hypothetical protein